MTRILRICMNVVVNPTRENSMFWADSVVKFAGSRKRRVFRGINPNLDTGCSMHSECSSQSGLLLAIGVHRGTWLPGESTSTFAALCVHVHCTSMRVFTRIARTRSFCLVYIRM